MGMGMKIMNRCAAASALVAAMCLTGAAGAEPLDSVKVGINNVVSDIVFHIAEQRGFFAEQRLQVQFIPFDSGPRMIAPLGVGQIDVGGGASSAGLYNAVARGIDVKIVADKGSTPLGYDYMPLLVRKDLVDSGQVKSFADLKGLKIAAAGPGSATNSKLSVALAKGGLTYKDSQNVNMSYPQQVAALTSKAIDASITTEPLATQAINGGVAVRLSDDTLYPGQQVAVLLYGSDLITKRRDVAQRFMIAYVKAARVYNDATKGGHFDGPGADAVVDLIMKTTGLKDAALVRSMIPNGISPNGTVNKASLADDLTFFVAEGLIEKPVKVDDVLDMSFADNAIKELGPYQAAR
jgi:NitT/TauT family transport system substrate-binding protein